MPIIDKDNITARLEQQADVLDCLLSDFEAKFLRALDSLNATAEGIDPQALPLQRLAELGHLDTVLCILENLSRHPERMEATLEVSSGSPLSIVGKCEPYVRGKRRTPAQGARPASTQTLHKPLKP